MTGRNGLLIKAALVVGGVWVVVWGVLQVTGAMKPTPEKLEAYIEENSLAEITDPEERKEVIGRIASMLNQMDAKQLRQMMEPEFENEENRGPPEFVRDMSPEEQRFFMEKRLGKAFQQMMAVFNDMERDERKRIVERTLRQMRRNSENSERLDRIENRDPEMEERIINEGLRAYYQEASAETKIDLAPVLEEMQKSMRFMGRRGGPPHR